MSKLYANGYVHDLIDNDLTFEQYMLRCARGFGALIMMRDENSNEEITIEKVVDDCSYHTEELQRAKDQLTRLEALDENGRIAFGHIEKATEVERQLKNKKEYEAACQKAESILAKVKEWQAPTPDHENLKKSAADWIIEAVGDKGKYYDHEIIDAENKSPLDYFNDALKIAKYDIEYHTKEMENERGRNQERLGWTKTLFDSLGIPLK